MKIKVSVGLWIEIITFAIEGVVTSSSRQASGKLSHVFLEMKCFAEVIRI